MINLAPLVREQRRRGDRPAARGHPVGNGDLLVVGPPARRLDSLEQEHAVVGGEPEDDCEEGGSASTCRVPRGS